MRQPGPTAEGRVLPPGSITSNSNYTNGIYRYEYQLKDHLGNLRVACRCGEKPFPTIQGLAASPADGTAPVVTQQVQYDPWGLQLLALSSVSSVGSLNRFTYNGKEEQRDLGLLDYTRRFYDPDYYRKQRKR